jgi:hypothetical protein
MITSRTLLAAALSAALFGGVALAQTTPTEPPAPGAAPAARVPQAAAAQTAVPPPAPNGAQPIPAARWTPAQIRQSFDQADTNSDGQLTRTEAQRLAILPRSFEDMDQNKDGVVTRAEYEAGFSAP